MLYAVSVVELKNLSVGRKKRLLLKNINIRLTAGQKWFLYGDGEAVTLYHLLSGLIRDYSGNVHINEYIPARREPDFYRQCCFIPSYFPILKVSCEVYIRHYLTMYPRLDRNILESELRAFGIDPSDNMQKLSFSKRKIFHLLLALSRRPEFLMIKELFHGLSESDRCPVHNLLREYVGSGQCLVHFGGKLSDYRDLIDNVAVFYNGTLLRSYSLAELSGNYCVFHVRSRRFLDHNPLHAVRMVRGWKVLDENPGGMTCPPDFDLLSAYFQEAGDLVKIKDRLENQDE